MYILVREQGARRGRVKRRGVREDIADRICLVDYPVVARVVRAIGLAIEE